MKNNLWKVVLVISLFELSLQQSTRDSPTYVAGVVEFQPHISISDPVLRTEANLGHYIRILQLETAAPADIIVFPESTLNTRETASYVPEADEDLVPCTASVDRFEATVRQISCMARNLRKYVVINLTEKSDCPDAQQIMFNDTSRCSPSGINFYNTNAVFDRRGAVISKYRKYNLFGEAGITQPRYPVSTSFETDFGVTFGHFVCFDLLFAYPALDLVRQGVTDIIFPAMWFSELPFLTASQIQQSWSFKNNVNLLASGANDPSVGSTGTGIFAGEFGPIITIMSPVIQRNIFVATVPKKNFTNAPLPVPNVPIVFTPTEMQNLFLKRDNVYVSYQTKTVNLSSAFSQEIVCHYGFCCDFSIDLTYREHTANEIHYYYRMAVFNGIRSFDGVATGGIRTCGIIACTDELDVFSCGRRFDSTENLVNSVLFNEITILAEYPSRPDLFMMPNSVDTSILPLRVDEFMYSEDAEVLVDGVFYRNITFQLTQPRDNLYSFGIYGRDFTLDNLISSTATKMSTSIVLTLVLAAVLFVILKQ